MADTRGFKPLRAIFHPCPISSRMQSITLPRIQCLWCTDPVTLRGLKHGKLSLYYLTTGANLVDVKRLELLTLCV